MSELTWHRVCAICNAYIAGNPEIPPTSHGYCPPCAEKEKKKILEYYRKKKDKRPNPNFTINSAYHYLVQRLPEHMDALNVCLVLGEVRSGTLVEPLRWPRQKKVNEQALNDVLSSFPLVAMKQFTMPFGNSYLIYDIAEQEDVDRLPSSIYPEIHQDPEIETTLGGILNYYCAGEWNQRFIVDYIIPNPKSGNPNPFLSYTCKHIDQNYIYTLRNYGRIIRDFLVDNNLDFPITLKISDKQGPPLPDGTPPHIYLETYN